MKGKKRKIREPIFITPLIVAIRESLARFERHYARGDRDVTDELLDLKLCYEDLEYAVEKRMEAEAEATR